LPATTAEVVELMRSDQMCFFRVSKIHAADRRICNYNALQLNQNCTYSKIKFGLTTKQCGALIWSKSISNA